MCKRIAIIGLGLIGGSMAMALKGFEDYEIVGVDRDPATLEFARTHGVADYLSTDAGQAVSTADVVYLCLHPRGIVDFLSTYRACFRPGTLVTDVCGIKTAIVDAAAVLPDEVDFIGSHPMAGKETSGIFHADGALFRGAHYILTPDADVPQESIHLLEQLVTFMGCADVVFSDPAAHDERIAYTSQLMHGMALALCDQHLLFDSYGFEGGSFRGATRVAALDPKLWCELFWANRETLADLTDELIERLSEYSALLHGGDRAALLERLTVSSDRKKKFDTLRGLDESQKPLFK